MMGNMDPMSGRTKIRVIRGYSVEIFEQRRTAAGTVGHRRSETRRVVLFKGTPFAFSIWKRRHQLLKTDTVEKHSPEA